MTEQTTKPKVSAKPKTATKSKAATTLTETASRFSMPFAIPTLDLSKVDLSKVDLSKVDLPRVDLSRFDPRELDVQALASTAKDAAVSAKSKATAVSNDVRKNITHTVTLVREAVGI